MDMSPQTIRSTGFKTVKKGYDPEEVDAFRSQVAATVENAQNQATAMEARARAAVAKLQEVSQQVAGPREAAPVAAPSNDAEVISRTLLLAQRTADSTLSEARAEADGITAQAREEASRVLESARVMAVKTVEEARTESRRAVEEERVRAENEVQALLARRDFLLADVDHLEQYMQSQRERVRDAAVQLTELVDRVPGGLGEMRRPLLSASAEPAEEPAAAAPAAVTSDADETAAITTDEPVETFAPPTPADLQSPDADGGANLTAMALSNSADDKDSVWRLLDEEVASTQAAQASFALDDDTGEVPAQSAASDERSGGSDEVQ